MSKHQHQHHNAPALDSQKAPVSKALLSLARLIARLAAHEVLEAHEHSLTHKEEADER